MKKILLTALALTGLLLSSLSHANTLTKRTVCVFDIAGSMGPVMQLMKDWKVAALSWGYDIKLVSYTSEKIAAADLSSGQCDASLITGIRARKFNKFSGTTDSIGSIQSLKEFRTVLHLLASPQLADKMNTEHFTIMGVAPAGAAYIFVDDRTINTLGKAAGKKVAVLSYDKTQAQMVSMVGAIPVPSDITNFSSRFNNHAVDVIAAPLAAYNALELYKGMNPDGGIIDFPLMQITLQLVGKRLTADKQHGFPLDFAQKSREYFYQHVDQAFDIIRKAKKAIPDKWWIEIPKKDKADYKHLMQKARVMLRDQGDYSADMLHILWKVRCNYHPQASECTNPVE